MQRGDSDDRQQLGELFNQCDLDGSGYIDPDELATICSDLSVEELTGVFSQLDQDGDGRISVDEFAKGYKEIAKARQSRSRMSIRRRLWSDKGSSEECLDPTDEATYVGGLDACLRELSCQEQVCELYQNLHGASNPELVTQFENILLNVLKDVRNYQTENERLEKTYKKEKDEHSKHLRRLEEDMEQQVQIVEERVRKQEQEKLEAEKSELRNQLDAEITMLQQNLKKLQQDGNGKVDTAQEEYLMQLKKRLEEINTEKRMLKSELTDAHTNLALVKSEMTGIKQKLDEKKYELEVENKTIRDYAQEQDNLRRQLQMLHEANKSLLDTNDNLREMIGASGVLPVGYSRTMSTDSGTSCKSLRDSMRDMSPRYGRKGSVIGDYIDNGPIGNRPLLNLHEHSGMMPRFLALNHMESCDDDHLAEDLDSGHSTLRDVNEIEDTEIDSVSLVSDIKRGRRQRRVRSNLNIHQEDEQDSHDEIESDSEHIKSPTVDALQTLNNNHQRSPSAGSRDYNKNGRTRDDRTLHREDSEFSQTSRSSRGSSRRQLPPIPTTLAPVTTPKVNSEPDRMYKIVLAGDAAVGKSSFIVRLCKGKFVPNLSSTLGVDFQTKMLEVDSHQTALQLWDTAGQERFRSVARTYFRRADGVLLLYDVTYERSFLNIRDWVDSIEEGAQKKIPFMLVGNKTDARPELESQGRRVVKYEDGLRLSKELNALFIETSAKAGSNITEAVIELTRILRTNEDLEVKSVGMQLSESKDAKKSGGCCGGKR